jgi:photosystem II stability/assembly factor-like uncharacterized protein
MLCLPITLSGQSVSADYLRNLPIRSIGPAAMSGRITAIAADPHQPRTIYAGAASGGVWRSKGGGNSWEPIFDNAPIQSVGAIAINPHNTDEIWVGTGEGNPRNSQNFGIGIFKSIDGGRNWQAMGLQNSRTIHRIVVHRDRPEVIFAASPGSATGPNEERGVFKSTDGGKSWRKVLYVNDLTGCADLVADPSNPNKMFAAMWEYRRWPWFFKSGGKGSGLYVTHDAGETWKKITDKDGLPEGELGRMGLAIAPGKPDVVYALVEAKENGLYRSDNGGRTWKKQTGKGMGDRPFYYSEIYVDPKNENRVYSIFTTIARSEDGGKTFNTWAGFAIHPDHHAFWISPEDPDYIINGNDGGLNITYDGGSTWRYADNLPLGQFYHVNVDNEIPYNIYGGLQDNGSWVGPSAIWRSGGIRNGDWQEILFGDGFDAMPRADDSRYCFAQSQGGYLSYIDRKTGFSQGIQPVHPEGGKLRFNWNSGLAQDPFNPKGIYFASQYLHYSNDLGQSWSLLSPDLTTNDTSKMHQDQSGGLTLDATNAENHCTIIAVAPSPVQRGVVWVGADDGQVQITRDGGKTWTNCAALLPGCPKNAWVPQIEVSAKNAGEAFVVVNNYRQNDWQPYLYRTKDYGATWQRLAQKVEGFCLSVVQDPEVPSLLFLGTDQGLYVSTDDGANWTHWPNAAGSDGKVIAGAFPSVPVYDMKIHPRDGDLIIATFGRAIWILDNIRPLREIARKGTQLLAQPFKLFPPQDGILAEYRAVEGARFAADETFKGQNKGTGIKIPVWLLPEKKSTEPAETEASKDKKEEKKSAKDKKEEKPVTKTEAETKEKGDKKEKDKDKDEKKDKKDGKDDKKKALVLIIADNGDTIRRFKSEIDTFFSHIYWNFDTKGVRFPTNNEPDKDNLEPGNGPQALPGTYKVVVHYGKHRDSVQVRVLEDPRLPVPLSERVAKATAVRAFQKQAETATKAYNRLKEAEKVIKLVEDQLVNVPDSVKKEVLKMGKTLQDSIQVLKDAFFMQKEPKGIERNPNALNAKLFRAVGYLNDGMGTPNATARLAEKEALMAWESLKTRVNMLFDQPWRAYQEKSESIKYSLFKPFDRL